MSVLYNSFRLATDSSVTCNARSMFRNQIDDTLYELEETLSVALDPNGLLVDYESFQVSPKHHNLPKGWLYSLNLYPRADDELFKNLTAAFNNDGDGIKIMLCYYHAMNIKAPSLTVFVPENKGRIAVYHPGLPVSEEASLKLHEAVDYIRMNNSMKIAEVVKTWLEKNFSYDQLEELEKIFQETIQEDQATLQFSRRSDDYNRVMNITRTAVAKLKR